jgi:glyoxylase-like metal-dependent hydrolase (beta-lactamase superfamily II)
MKSMTFGTNSFSESLPPWLPYQILISKKQLYLRIAGESYIQSMQVSPLTELISYAPNSLSGRTTFGRLLPVFTQAMNLSLLNPSNFQEVKMFKWLKTIMILFSISALMLACSTTPEATENTGGEEALAYDSEYPAEDEGTVVEEEESYDSGYADEAEADEAAVVEEDNSYDQSYPQEAEPLNAEIVSSTDPEQAAGSGDFPQTLAYIQHPPDVDPARGYFVDEIADGIYWLMGSQYQAMFLTTGEGVIVIDAPQPIGESYLDAIREVTDEPITHQIYSHSHADHIGAAGIFPQGIEVIAHQDVLGQLPNVPNPTVTFENSYTLEVGNQLLELSYVGTPHSRGDIVIYAPRQKVLMVVDLFHPGSAPFGGFGATIDLGAHLQAHDVILENFDFDLLIAGHTQILGTKAHLETNKAFTLSMLEIVKQAILSGPEDQVIQTCFDGTVEQWTGVLANLENRVMANCQAMANYVLSQPALLEEASTEQTETTTMTDSLNFSLPERSGSRQRTSGIVPHVQIGINPDAAVNDELFRRAYLLPGVEDRPTTVSLPGGRGMWLSDDVAVDNPGVILSGREFAHIHTDGSLHAPLPVDRALEVAEKGWGEMHPWSGERPRFDGFMMLYTPLTMEELEVTFQLIVESYNHVTGQAVQAADFE